MKVVQVTVSGTPTIGDRIQLFYTSPRGGRSTAAYTVRGVEDRTEMNGGVFVVTRPESLEEVVTGIVASTGKPGSWAGDFQLKSRGASFLIICPDTHSDVTFFAEVLGAGTEKLEVIEL